MLSIRKNYFVLPVLLAGISFSTPPLAENSETPDVKTSGDAIIAKHRYMMGDNDSKSEASKVCFLEAKSKAIEYAGIYVESTVQQNQTDKAGIFTSNSRSNMRSIAAATVSAELVSSKTGFDNGKMFVDCVVKAKVDKSKLKEAIERMAAHPDIPQQENIDPKERVIGTARSFKVTKIGTVAVDGKLRVQLEVLNDRGRRDVLYFRAKWMDATGSMIGQYEPWKTESFEGGQSSMIVIDAPSQKAVDFRIEIKPQS